MKIVKKYPWTIDLMLSDGGLEGYANMINNNESLCRAPSWPQIRELFVLANETICEDSSMLSD